MGWDLLIIMVAPFLVSVACWWAPVRTGQLLTLMAGAATFVVSILYVPTTKPTTILSGWIRVDALSVVFLVAVGFLYLATAIFAIGYVHPDGDTATAARYTRRFFAGLNPIPFN